MPAPILQFKRGNAGVAGTVPALRPGEPAISLNNFDFFIGIDTSVSNNKFFGSHRYWGREDGTTSLKLKLVDKDGTNGVHLKTPNTLSGIGTYTLPDTNTIQDGYFLKVATDGTLSWDNVGGSNGTFSNPTLTGITTISGNYFDVNVNSDFSGITTFSNTTDNTLGNANTGSVQIDGGLGVNKNVTIGAGLSAAQLTIGTGVAATQFSSSVSSGSSTSSVPTSSAVIDYVTSSITAIDQDDDLSIAGNSGTGTVDLDTQSLTVTGSANQVTTSASGQTITISLVNDVVVGTSLSVPTIKTSTIQHSNGTQAATIDSSGNITASQNLTVSGNLYVNGNTTQVNTDTLTVEDRTIELGRVIAGQPTSTTWDLAVLFNYGDGAAKKAGVVWEASGATKRFQFTTDVNPGSDGGPSDTNLPQFSVANFAPIEISELWVNNTCTGGSQQVIGCVGSELQLQNITIDAGQF